MKRVKVLAVVGARPQFVKAAAIAAAHQRGAFGRRLDLVWVHTGQHYDPLMSDVFFKELRLPKPRYHLSTGGKDPATGMAEMLRGLERTIAHARPSAVLVFGDTNSTLAGAISAAKAGILLAHVEAGLRSFDRRMPEEENRVVTDHLSQLLLCPTRRAVSWLAQEGIRKGVYFVGDVMADLILAYRRRRRPSSDDREAYYLATIHRNFNTDDPARLGRILRCLQSMDLPVVFPLHPRTRQRITVDRALKGLVSRSGNLRIIEPVPYGRMLDLQAGSRGVLTDSGGIQKEAFLLGVPCVTFRGETEWPETVDSGLNTLCPDADPGRARAALKRSWARAGYRRGVNAYGRGDAAERILTILSKEVRQ